MFELIEVTNLLNGKKYIGIIDSENPEEYWGASIVIKKAIAKYATENFTRTILSSSDNYETLYKEYCQIAESNRIIYSPDYYNVPESIEERNNYFSYLNEMKLQALRDKHLQNIEVYKSDAFRKKMSTVTSGEKNGMYGRHHSEATKRHIGKLNKQRRQGNV